MIRALLRGLAGWLGLLFLPSSALHDALDRGALVGIVEFIGRPEDGDGT
jgi:hypothetical protein